MRARVYLNTTSRAITRKLDQSPFSWPKISQGEDIILRFQLSETNDGFTELSDIEVKSLSVRVGKAGQKAEFGTYQLVIEPPEGAENVTADIAYGATADQLAAAINALTDAALEPLLPCTVVEQLGVYRVQFADKTANPTIGVAENSLWPVSFVNVKKQEWDEGNLYLISHRQTSGAITATLGTRAPDLPVVTNEGVGTQQGTSEDGLILNEIQKLVIPGSYAGGAFQIDREGRKSGLIALPTSEELMAEALAPIAEEGGPFVVRSSSQAFYIEFTGTMGGQPQPVLGIVPFDPPKNDHYLKLKTKTGEMEALLRSADSKGEIELPLHIKMQTVNEIDALELDEFVWDVPLTFTLPPDDGGNNAAQDTVWNQEPSRLTILPHSPGSVLVGHRSYRYVFGDGVNEAFAIPHDLGNLSKVVTVDTVENEFTGVDHNFHNLDPITIHSDDEWPAPLTDGMTVWVRDRTADTFKVSERANGEVLDLTTAGVGSITAKMNDGSGDGYHVTVFEREGNKARVPDSAYTAEQTTEGTVTLKDFAVTPTNKQYVAYITSVGRPATWQDFEIQQNRVIGLEEWKAMIEARMAALEDVAPKGFSRVDRRSGYGQRWLLPVFTELFPFFDNPNDPSDFVFPESGRLAAIDSATLPRAPRLLPAVHTGTILDMPSTGAGRVLNGPNPDITYRGKVYENRHASGKNIFLPGGRYQLKPGEFAACDGRAWYQVVQFRDENSYYSEAFDRLLYRDAVTQDQLASGRGFSFEIPVEVQTVGANTVWHYTFVIETGQLPAEGVTFNLEEVVWDETPKLEVMIPVTQTPRIHTFGFAVNRGVVDGEDTLTAEVMKYGAWDSIDSPPQSSTFAVRARLLRGDTENDVLDASGFIAVSTVPEDSSNQTLGVAQIS